MMFWVGSITLPATGTKPLTYLQRAEEIDPTDIYTLKRLSLHYQYGPEMIRFNDPEKLLIALDYQKRLVEEGPSDEEYNDLFYILGHLDRWEEIQDYIDQVEKPLLAGIFGFISQTAQKGVEQGFEALSNLSREDFGQALELALGYFISTGDYNFATDILRAVSQGAANRMALESQADPLRGYQPIDEDPSSDDPITIVKSFLWALQFVEQGDEEAAKVYLTSALDSYLHEVHGEEAMDFLWDLWLGTEVQSHLPLHIQLETTLGNFDFFPAGARRWFGCGPYERSQPGFWAGDELFTTARGPNLSINRTSNPGHPHGGRNSPPSPGGSCPGERDVQ
jgi:hypothetical protein